MRKFIIIFVIANGLAGFSFGQKFISMNFSQPAVLNAIAGQDTLVCTGHPVSLGGKPAATGGSSSYLYLWTPSEGLNDPTSPNPVATLTGSKTYKLLVTDINGCQASSYITVKIDACTGVNTNRLNQELTIFPNPSVGVFSILGLSALNSKLQKIEVFNQLGQTLFIRFFDSGFFVSDLVIDTKIKVPGIYFLKISLSDRLVSKRLIVR